jgi:hypothetical protein
MRKILCAALLGAAIIPAQSSTAAPVASSASSSGGVCAALRSDYAQIERMMASRSASGLLDDSAPRETMRAAQDTADISRAQVIISLMQANKCGLPDHAPTSITYLSAALTCRADRMKSSDAPSCKMEDWQASK